MNFTGYLLVATLMLLSACGDSHRPTYSGHQESTEGVPGFKNGKKTSPYNKLGQSYTVDGETYVPRNQPDYVEEGMASWYGPGFHGGKTANGEQFDTNGLTGAHRTLPLPSIVRVTMLSNGKQVFVRINDRGPFAHSRIIDLSRGAADKIGLLRAGVAKVRVEYMPKESQRLADLMEQGRDPHTIDLASDIIGYEGDYNPQSPRADTRMNVAALGESRSSGSFWDNFGSSPSNATEPTPEAAVEALNEPIETSEAAPVSDVMSHDLAAPSAPNAAGKPFAQAKVTPRPAAPAPVDDSDSPFAVLDSGAGEPSRPLETAALAPARGPVLSEAAASGSYVQLGAFSNEDNAQRLVNKYKDVANLHVVPKPNASGQVLFHVRAGPFGTVDDGMAVRDKLSTAGADAHMVRE